MGDTLEAQRAPGKKIDRLADLFELAITAINGGDNNARDERPSDDISDRFLQLMSLAHRTHRNATRNRICWHTDKRTRVGSQLGLYLIESIEKLHHFRGSVRLRSSATADASLSRQSSAKCRALPLTKPIGLPLVRSEASRAFLPKSATCSFYNAMRNSLSENKALTDY